MSDVGRNKKGKSKSNHIVLFGNVFCLPKGIRKIIDKTYPELKGKIPLDEKDLPKVLCILEEQAKKNKEFIKFLDNLKRFSFQEIKRG